MDQPNNPTERLTYRWYRQDDFLEKLTLYRTGTFREDHQSKVEKDVDQLLSFGDFTPHGKIIDLGCGEGYHAGFLSKAGFKVTGLDASQFMMRRAKENIKRLGGEVVLKRLEMVEWQEKGSYDAVLSFGHSFGFFEELSEGEKIIKNVYDSLRPGGKFFIEIYGKEMFDRIYPRTLVKEKEGTTLVRLCNVFNGYEKFESLFYFLKDNRVEIFKEGSYLYSAQELKALLEGVGFKILGIYGDYLKNPYDHRAESLMMLAEKS